jgi:threonine/homoserine/homoserine lactone efflux protein
MLTPLITGITMGLYLAISVGPILFTVIKQSLNNGVRGGFSFVAGIWFSDILFVLISNVFTVFTTHVAEVYIRQIGYGGGLLLLLLGGYYIFFKSATVAPMENGRPSLGHLEVAKLFAAGFVINTLNPILFFEWLTAATLFARTYSINYRILIFSTCLAVNILADTSKVLLAGKIRPRLTVHNLSIINKITGALLLVCGLFILYQTFFHADKWKSREEKAAAKYAVLHTL